jgi:DNA-binding transcriptional LysR family regulator
MRDADRWGALEVRHLRAFAAVVDEGSYARAAGLLGYSQSGVSQQIFALERIVGEPLLIRHPGGRHPLELTEPGRIVLAHARPLLARVSVTQADLGALAAGASGELIVVTIQSIGARILPGVLGSFRERYGGVRVRIIEARAADELLAAVESGDADVGLTALPVAAGPFEVHGLLTDPYVLVTRVNRIERELADLDGVRLLGIRGCSHDRLVEQRLLAEGIVPSVIERFDDNGMIQALVAAGEGVAVVPRLVVDVHDPRVAVHALPELPARQLVAIVHVDRRPGIALRRFVTTAIDVSASFETTEAAQNA